MRPQMIFITNDYYNTSLIIYDTWKNWWVNIRSYLHIHEQNFLQCWRGSFMDIFCYKGLLKFDYSSTSFLTLFYIDHFQNYILYRSKFNWRLGDKFLSTHFRDDNTTSSLNVRHVTSLWVLRERSEPSDWDTAVVEQHYYLGLCRHLGNHQQPYWS